MAAGSPSLATPSLAYSPFASSRRQAAPAMPANYGTGFSEDGLSYEVASDFNKLASQALAEYEARLRNPRTDVWGKVLAEDTPAALHASILQPVAEYIGGGTQATQQQPIIREIGNTIFERKADGNWVPTAVGPQKAQAPTKFPGPTELGDLREPKSIKNYSAADWLNLAPSLPPQIATNAPVANYIDWGRQSNAIASGASAPMMAIKFTPLPKSKADLKSGQTYQTSRGPAKWDGTKFVQ